MYIFLSEVFLVRKYYAEVGTVMTPGTQGQFRAAVG